MTIRILVAAIGVVLLLASPGWAQSTTTTSSTTIPTGNFDSLSPGNQKIANALFSAQKPTGTQTALTKNQIAGLRSTEGWGRVFKTMKADGLIQARNLGHVVSSYQHSLHASTTSTARSGSRFSTRGGSRFGNAGMTGGRGFAGGSHAMGGRLATSSMGSGFGHGGMGGGGFSHGGGGGHGR
jgi:hypothetical protein